MYFVDVILPIPVENSFTYRITDAQYAAIKPGMRLAVPFGKTKIYTALSIGVHENEPRIYEAKEIEEILDEEPVVHLTQLNFWKWMADYYMCTLGDVMRAALPGAFMLESETIVKRSSGFKAEKYDLDGDGQLIAEALIDRPILKIHEVMDILGKKKVLPEIKKLIDLGVVELEEEIYEAYKPKLVKYVKLSTDYDQEERMHAALDDLERASVVWPLTRDILTPDDYELLEQIHWPVGDKAIRLYRPKR